MMQTMEQATIIVLSILDVAVVLLGLAVDKWRNSHCPKMK